MHRLAQLDRTYVWHPFTQMRDWLKREPIVILSGKGAVLRDAARDAAAVEPHRPVDVEAPDPLVVQADEARIRQVVANLVGNVRMQGLGRVLGSVGSEVLHNAPCNVLIVKTV